MKNYNLIRLFKHIVNSASIAAKEKCYKNKLKYILEKNLQSDTLVVIFSGFPGKGKAKYNYMRTLQDVSCNKLFILDDFGYKQRGAYYLAENGDFYVQNLVKELISEIRDKLHVQLLITVGSSKGGTSAIYHGLRAGCHAVIAGAPQYFLYDYLNTEAHRPILDSLVGGVLVNF